MCLLLYFLSQTGQYVFEIFGQFRVQVHRFPCAGVDELQLLGVEALTNQPLFGELGVSVHLVTQQGMTDVCHVHANLVGAARFQLAADMGVASVTLQYRPVGDRIAAVLVGDCHLLAVVGMTSFT